MALQLRHFEESRSLASAWEVPGKWSIKWIRLAIITPPNNMREVGWCIPYCKLFAIGHKKGKLTYETEDSWMRGSRETIWLAGKGEEMGVDDVAGRGSKVQS